MIGEGLFELEQFRRDRGVVSEENPLIYLPKSYALEQKQERKEAQRVKH